MGRRSLVALIGVFVFLGAFPVRTASAAEILVIHSYERGLAWTASMHRGLVEVLGDEHVLYVEDLDAKRFPVEALETEWAQLLKIKYGARPIDLIVTTDDPARLLVSKLHEELFEGVPVVFAGADHLNTDAIRRERAWMTGVSEAIQPGPTLEAIPAIIPTVQKIWVLADQSPTGTGNAEAALAVQGRLPPGVELELVRDPSWSELRTRLAKAPPDVAVMWMHFIEDGRGLRKGLVEALRAVVEASAAPVFSSWDFSLANGAVGGWITSGRAQGRMAGELGLRILGGETPGAIPVVLNGGNEWKFGWDAMERFGIRSDRLPDGASVVGRPPSIWDTHRVELGAALAVLVVSCLSTLFLAVSDQARRRSGKRLRRINERFQAFFEALPFGVLMAEEDPEGTRVVAANPAARSMSRQDPKDKRLEEVVPVAILEGPGESRVVQDGEEKIFDGRSFELPSKERVVVFRDITEQRQLQRELIEAQKREAVGRLAAGVAHDLNNILQCIFTSTTFILDEELPHEIREDAELVSAAAQKASALTTQLLGFVRKSEARPRTVELGELLRPFCGLLRRVLGETFQLSLELSSPPPSAVVDPGQLEQVLLNLVLNARDAMPNGGKIRISARPDGDQVRLEVEDEGLGIDSHTLGQIFEPFFTTKGPDRGTGLGLSMVKELLESQEGRIEVQSTPGRGSCFRVHLPSAQAEPRADSEALTLRRSRGDGQVVLLVEDDPSVRRTTRRALERAGYKVLVATDVASARDLFAREGADILFSDVVLPDGSGRDLAQLLQAEDPQLKVILTSGYDPEEPSWSEEVLRKPFALHELFARLEASTTKPSDFN